jgi:hypothetical protein
MRYKGLLSVSILAAVAAIAFAAGAATAKKSTMVGATELVWEDYAPGVPLKVAKLWGDRTKGEYAMLLKMPAGFEAGMHSHSADYHAINVQGNWVHSDDGGEAKELPVSSYVMQPGKAFHNDVCKGTQDCILFVHQHKKGDFIPKPAPKEEKK